MRNCVPSARTLSPSLSSIPINTEQQAMTRNVRGVLMKELIDTIERIQKLEQKLVGITKADIQMLTGLQQLDTAIGSVVTDYEKCASLLLYVANCRLGRAILCASQGHLKGAVELYARTFDADGALKSPQPKCEQGSSPSDSDVLLHNGNVVDFNSAWLRAQSQKGDVK